MAIRGRYLAPILAVALAAPPSGALAGVPDDEVTVDVRGWKRPVRVPRSVIREVSGRPSNEVAATTLQVVAGTGTTVVLVGVGLGMALCECDSYGNSPYYVLAAIPLVSSAVVYGVGRAFDGRRGGSFGATLLGGALGSAAGLGLLKADADSPALVIAALALPTAGAIAGYKLSRPSTSALVNLDGGRLSFGVPLPRPKTARSARGLSRAGYQLDLVRVSF